MVWRRPGVCLLGVLVALLLPSQGAAWHSRRLLEATSYKNLLEASQSEVRVIQQLYNGVYREQGWANTDTFGPLLKVAMNPSTNLTAFFPSDDSWQRVADYYCLTQQGVLDNISNLREMLANYIKSHLIGNMTLHSSDFRDGMVLRSLARPSTDPNGPSVNHTISKVVTNGTVRWVFKNASIYKIPGTFNYEDINVNPKRMDIKAGNAIIHVIDTLFRNPDTERFWEGLRMQVLERAGLPPNSETCPANVTSRASQESFAPSQIAGMVIGVVIGLLLLAGVLMLVFVVRAHDGGSLWKGPLRKLSVMGRKPAGGSGGGGGSGGSPGDGSGSPASGSGEAFTSPLLHLPPRPPPPQQQLLAGGPGSLQTASSWQSVRVSGSSVTSSMVVRPDSQADSMSVLNADSPFAAVRGGPHTNAQHLPAAALAGPSVFRQASSVAGDTDSSGGYHRTTDSMGSGTPLVSRGSIHGSKKDLLALAAAAAHHAHTGSDQPLEFDSLVGGLAATESVPVGRINHEHVIPFSELSLKELIGSGAEGKVYRGTWKHTDIAAKEYLPIEPAQEAPSSSSKDSPSDAAMAHARAALAKEVHWLTSLNHPNLVRFCAVCLERPLVVMEFYKHGSVFAMLQKAARELARSQQARRKGYVAHFNWDRRLEMLHDVAAGMSYLHGKDHVHGDLRSPNLFVGADSKVKIGDFGFTKRLACNTASLKVKRITHPRWVAPELMMDNMMSRASDVYSFGIIMYELLTFRIPFDMLGKEQVVINVVQGFRPDVPEESHLPPGTSSSTCLFTYVRLMKECWAHDPKQRPSFEVIARRLKAMQRWRKIISKHSALHRAASALRQSSSSSSLTKEGGGNKVAGSSAAAAHGDAAAAAAGGGGSAVVSVLTANGNGGPSTPALSRARSSKLGSGTAAAAAAAAVAAESGMPPRAPIVSGAASMPSGAAGLVPEYSSSECDNDSLPEFEDFEDADAMQYAGSVPVSEAVVAGTRLAVIGVCSHQDERDALASVAGAELSLARKVVLVGSDLPAGTFSRLQSMRGTGMSSLEETQTRRSGGSTNASFTAGPQGNRFHSVTGGDVSRRQLQEQPDASAATVAAAALAVTAAAAAAKHSMPPNGKTAAGASGRKAAARTGSKPEEAHAGPAAGDGDGEQQQHHLHRPPQRRHSDPLPGKKSLSPAVSSSHDSGTVMSGEQSPLAVVHVGPAGLACGPGLQHGGQAADLAAMQLLQSYPLSNTGSEVFSPLPSAASTPDQLTENKWGAEPSKQQHQQQLQALAASKQQQQQHRGQQQVQRVQLRQQGSGSSSSSSRDQHLQSSSILRRQQEQDWQQLQQSQPQQQHSASLQDAQAALVTERSVFEEAAAAAAARDEQEQLGEVFTPYDSPFYQDLDMGSWAPSASVCDSQPNSLGICMPSGAAGLGVCLPSAGVASAMSSTDSGTAGGPFVEQQLQQAGLLRPAAAAGQEGGSFTAQQAEGSFTAQQAEGSTVGLPWSSQGRPTVLKQAVTIEYQANLTPMAAAAAEAVSVHGTGRRSGGTAPGSAAGSRPGSVVGGGPHAAAAAAVAAAAAAAAAGAALQPGKVDYCNGPAAAAAAGGSVHGSISTGGGSQADVAASADTCAPPAAGGGLAAKFPSAPVQQPHRARSPAPAVSDQQQLRGWTSHMDAPRGAAASGDGADTADSSNAERSRPGWMRLLGIRRSLPGGA